MNEQEFIHAVAVKVAALSSPMGQCGTVVAPTGSSMACQNVLWSPISTAKFYRACRTNIDQVVSGSGTLPLAPGESVTLAQAPHPGWLGGCYQITYRLANAGVNHGDIKFEWFLDDEQLDTETWGSEIYGNDNGLIGDGKHPLPMHCGFQCCIGGLNTLKVRITHTGTANQLEAPRIFVQHGKAACCNACGSGQSCQTGCATGAGLADHSGHVQPAVNNIFNMQLKAMNP